MACPTVPHRGTYGVIIGCLSPTPRFRTGSRRGEKQAHEQLDGEVEKARSEFSGYIAADELYDGPFCVLFIVDNRTHKRLIYEVLDHDPTHEDIKRFFRRFKDILEVRALKLKGITTDASPLYPEPTAEVFGDVAHQICQFHIIAELTKAILKAVSQERKKLKATLPKWGRGRPSKKNRKAARRYPVRSSRRTDGSGNVSGRE